MRFYRSKFFIISLCAAILLVLVPSALSVFGYTDLVRSALKTVAHPFEWIGTKSADAVSGFVSVFTDYNDLKAENEALRAELEAKINADVDASVEELTENTDTAQKVATTATVFGGTALICNIALIAWALIRKKRFT